MKSLKLKNKIYFTLLYYNIFGFPLTDREIFEKLIGFKSEEKIKFSDFKKNLEEIKDKKIILKKENLYSLKIVNFNFKHREIKKKIWLSRRFFEVSKIKKFLKFCPLIKASFLTGSDSLRFASKYNDYDVLVICRKNSLWLVRFYVLLVASILGKRRKYSKTKKSDWCFNLFLEENQLLIPQRKRTLFSACEINNMKFLTGDSSLKEDMIENNFHWLKNYLVNLEKISKDFIKKTKRDSFLISLLNNVFYLFQFAFLKNKITNEFISKHQAFFHPQNRQNFLDEMLFFIKKSI
jgi:hypothetical protein